MPRRHYEVKDRLDEVQRAKGRLEEEAGTLRARVEAGEDDDGTRERLSNIERGVERKDIEYAELKREWEEAITEGLARGELQTEAGCDLDGSRQSREPVGQQSRARDGAMRTIELHVQGGNLTAEAADRVDGVLRGPDAPYGLDAKYIEAHGSAAYERAFAKLLRWGDGATLRMTAEEQQAVQSANQAEEMRTAMAEGTGSTGGFGIPIQIDPTINLSSNGAINPIRALATVRTMASRELRLVASDGVVAQYQAEAAEAIDNSPTLVQPTITAQRCTSFVPFSWEVGDDWNSLVSELVQLVADAKDVVEATKFLTGTGTNEPVGVLAVGSTGSLTTTQRVQTAGAGAIAIGDVYSLKQALGQTRFAASATWAMNPTRLDTVFRLTPSGSTTEPQVMVDRNGPLLGRPTAEWSTMATVATTATKWALYGDFKRGYTIADRLGMSASLVPHLFGSGSRFPTGQRGLYCYWRNSAVVTVPNALRYGETL